MLYRMGFYPTRAASYRYHHTSYRIHTHKVVSMNDKGGKILAGRHASRTGTGNHTSITQVRCGSYRKFHHTKEQARAEARVLQYKMMQEGRTGKVQVLASRFVRKVNHHWTKRDIIDFLNGEYGWAVLYDVSIKNGKVTKYVDKVYIYWKHAELTEFYTDPVNGSPLIVDGFEIIQNDPSLTELCKRAPSPLAFRTALRKLGILKKPLTASVANYAWKVMNLETRSSTTETSNTNTNDTGLPSI